MTSDSKLYGENVSSALMEKLFVWEQSCCYYSHHAAELVQHSVPSLVSRGKTAQSKVGLLWEEASVFVNSGKAGRI